MIELNYSKEQNKIENQFILSPELPSLIQMPTKVQTAKGREEFHLEYSQFKSNKKNTPITQVSHSTAKYLPKRNKSTCPHKTCP